MLYYLIIFAFMTVSPYSLMGNSDSLYFEEDGRNWVFAGTTKVGEKTYVPENQDPQNWDEAIILHHINAENIPLEVYYESFMSILNEKSGNAFKSQVIDHTDDFLIFEWWVDPNEDSGGQHGLIKVSKTPLGLQFFRYTTKNVDFVDSNKDIWAHILRANNFSVVPKKVNVNVDFSLDGRDWNLADSSSTNQKFILDGESLDQWTEQFSIDVFAFEERSPYAFYHRMIRDIEDKTGKNVETKVIDSGMDHIIFEWKMDEGDGSRWSFYKMTVLDNKLASGMQYSSKFENDEAGAKSVWEDIMKKARANISYDYLLDNGNKENIESQGVVHENDLN